MVAEGKDDRSTVAQVRRAAAKKGLYPFRELAIKGFAATIGRWQQQSLYRAIVDWASKQAAENAHSRIDLVKDVIASDGQSTVYWRACISTVVRILDRSHRTWLRGLIREWAAAQLQDELADYEETDVERVAGIHEHWRADAAEYRAAAMTAGYKAGYRLLKNALRSSQSAVQRRLVQHWRQQTSSRLDTKGPGELEELKVKARGLQVSGLLAGTMVDSELSFQNSRGEMKVLSCIH